MRERTLTASDENERKHTVERERESMGEAERTFLGMP
jgi:hypothetical protein